MPAMPRPLDVLLVDDDPSERIFIEDALEAGGHAHALDYAESGRAALAHLKDRRPDLMILDVRMPGRDGLSILEATRQRGVDVPIIVMSGHADVAMAVRALKSGAQDFVEKPFEARELLDAIGRLLSDRREYLKRRADEQAALRRLDSLTPRELEVAERLAQGLSNKETARELDISPRTVETHRAHILSKLDIRSVSQLVRILMSQ